MTYTIYAIVHLASADAYVGCSVAVDARWGKHRRLLHRGVHHSPALQEAWSRDGEGAFEFQVVDRADDKMSAKLRELHWITAIGRFNAMPVAPDGRSFTMSDTARAIVGVKSKAFLDANPDIKGRLIDANVARGKSDEFKAHMQKITAERWANPETRAALEAGLAKARSSPLRRERQMASTQDPEVIAKKVAAIKAAWADPNSSLRNRSNGRWADPEARKRASETMKRINAERKAAKVPSA